MKPTRETIIRYAGWKPHLLNHAPAQKWVLRWERVADSADADGSHLVVSDTYDIPWKDLEQYDPEVQAFIKDIEKKKWEQLNLKFPDPQP